MKFVNKFVNSSMAKIQFVNILTNLFLAKRRSSSIIDELIFPIDELTNLLTNLIASDIKLLTNSLMQEKLRGTSGGDYG